jgi:hypothetical protein
MHTNQNMKDHQIHTPTDTQTTYTPTVRGINSFSQLYRSMSIKLCRSIHLIKRVKLFDPKFRDRFVRN